MKNTKIEIPSGTYCTRDIEGKCCPWYYRNNDNYDTCGCPKISLRLDEDDEGVLRSGDCIGLYPLGGTVTITAKEANDENS